MLSKETTMKVIQKKVCLLGDFAVGKTSLVRQFVEGRFDDRYLSTIGVKISRKTLIRPNHQLNLLLWDLAGSEEYDDTESGYLRGAAGALLVCDLTREATLPSLARYAYQLRRMTPTAKLVVLANKADLADQRRIELEALHNTAVELNTRYFLTSAKTGENVEDAFAYLADLLEA